MQLEYTSKAPLGYHPKSFHPGSEHTQRLLDANIPEKEDYTMNTGFNRYTRGSLRAHMHPLTFYSIAFRCNLPEFLQLSQNSPIIPNLPRSTGSEFEMMLRNDCAVETRSNVQRSSSIFSASDGDPTQNEIVRQYQGVVSRNSLLQPYTIPTFLSFVGGYQSRPCRYARHTASTNVASSPANCTHHTGLDTTCSSFDGQHSSLYPRDSAGCGGSD